MPMAVRVAVLLWLVAQFTLTVAYVMPLNPVTVALQPLLQATIGAYFPQGWAFFAPDPGWSVPLLLARPLSPAEAAAVPEQGLPADGWYDLSTPLWERFHDQRLSAYARIGYPQLRATLAYTAGGDELALLAESCRKGGALACETAEARVAAIRPRTEQLLARIGSAFCNERFPGQDVSHVALRLRETPIAAWAERYGESPGPHEIDLGVFPIDRDVATANLWRDGQPR